MKLEIIDKKENKLLSRTEISAKLEFSGSATPSNDNVKNEVAKSIGKDAKLVVVKSIYTDYGNPQAKVSAYAYDDEKKLKEIERIKDKDGSGEAEKPKEEAKSAEEPKEAAKPDENKEEPKAQEEAKSE